MNQKNIQIMLKTLRATMLLFVPSFLAMFPRMVLSQQTIDTPICYMRNANGSIVDLTIFCKQNREENTPNAVQNIELSTSDREKLNAFSEEMSEACGKLPTQCADRKELLNQMRIICSTPNRCPNYINENLQRTRS
ncbi:MAG: hypothetical protein WBG73_01040 [Coleofasciculaceae cyanobacterium]